MEFIIDKINSAGLGEWLIWLDELFTYNPRSPLLFNSGQFLFLFLGFFALYIALLRQDRLRIVYVILFSLFFYYKSSGVYFVLLLFSTFVDYYLGRWIYYADNKFSRRLGLLASMMTNLGMLAYFKYTNFFIGILNPLFSSSVEPMDIFLPVGISFYTFQTMSYTIDIYRGKLKPLRSMVDFAFFVTFFPQLVAGPIVRASDFIPQIGKKISVTREDLSQGLMLIASGLFKKAVISDYIGVNFVDRVFDNPMFFTGFENLMAIYGYAIQIYGDFSGYSDIAIGIALLMGFRLPENFRTPYQSANLREFWRRWHISLSQWLRDYLYISMGGNRKGIFRTYLHLMLTMLLGGLWHGANWKFVYWGALHGGALALERGVEDIRKLLRSKVPSLDNYVMENLMEHESFSKRFMGNIYANLGIGYWNLRNWMEPFLKLIRRPISVILTFHFVCYCWVYFRADSFEMATNIINQVLYSFHPEVAMQALIGYKKVFLMIGIAYLIHFMPQSTDKWWQDRFLLAPSWAKSVILALIMWLVIQTQSADVQPFIYFQF